MSSSGSRRINNQPAPSRQPVLEEESLEGWFRKMGFNPEDPSKMKPILNIIRSNPKMNFCFQHLKINVRPTLEAKKIRKYYLHNILMNNDSNFDISEQYAVRGKMDLDRSIKFEKANCRIRALECIKFTEGMNLMKKLEAKVELLNNDYKVLISDVIGTNEIIFNLKELHSLLTQTKTELRSLINVSETLQGEKPGSVDFEDFINKSIAEVTIEDKNPSNKIQITYNGLKSLINELKGIEEKFKSVNLVEIIRSIELETPSNASKQSTCKTNLKSFLSNLFDKNIHILDLLGNSITCINTFKNEVESRNIKISRQLLNFKSQTDEMILKLINLIDNPQRNINGFKISKKNDVKSLMGEKNFLLAESILAKWGTSFESPNIIPIVKSKYQELEFYRSLKLKNTDEGPNNLFSLLLIAETTDSTLKGILDQLNDWSLKMENNPKDIDKLGPKVFELMSEMSFVKIHDVPLPEIMKRVKLAMIELDRLMHLEF